MRIIHGAGYTDSDREQFRVLIYRNIFLGMILLTEAMDNLNISYTIAANKVSQIWYTETLAPQMLNYPV